MQPRPGIERQCELRVGIDRKARYPIADAFGRGVRRITHQPEHPLDANEAEGAHHVEHEKDQRDEENPHRTGDDAPRALCLVGDQAQLRRAPKM